MSHLSLDRVLALALGEQARGDESRHLKGCPRCLAALEAERELSSLLVQLPHPPVPAGFALRTAERFRLSQTRPVLAALGLGAGLPLLIALYWFLGGGAVLLLLTLQAFEKLTQALAVVDGLVVASGSAFTLFGGMALWGSTFLLASLLLLTLWVQRSRFVERRQT